MEESIPPQAKMSGDDELERTHTMMVAAFENSYSGIMITDADAVLVSVNPAFTRITGYVAEEVIGKNPRLLSSGRQDKAFYQAMWHDITESGHWQGEIWNRRKSGEVYPEWLSISPVRDRSGRLTHYVGIFSDISEHKAAEAQIEFLAHHDPLTGLPNRLLLRDRFERAIAHAVRAGEMVALLFIDLDDFKNINDSLGHPVGDQVLQVVGRRLRGCMRETDTVSRQGGDEFLVMLTGITDSDAVAQNARKILERLTEDVQTDGRILNTSGSIGISMYPADGRDFNTLLKHADTALYHAKASGRSAYRFFTEAMNASSLLRFELENHLRRAIENNDFVLHYQPVIEFGSNRIVGAEALIRWHSPKMGMVAPGRFIPLAEETGMIVPIGEWVLMEACRQAQEWRRDGLPDMIVAVNLSAVQFRRGNLVETVAAALAASGLPPACLELELTESILIHDTEHTLDMVRQLKSLGVRLSLDDFGTGYSSLSYLKRFAVDKLKIDQSFVRDMVGDEDVAAIVRAMLDMGRNLRLLTIAEGVERKDQMEFLVRCGCTQGQGYYFSRPVPAQEFVGLYSESGCLRVA
ncbi:MAG: EAL domain-containing protein [Pseudomonadota bacterium]